MAPGTNAPAGGDDQDQFDWTVGSRIPPARASDENANCRLAAGRSLSNTAWDAAGSSNGASSSSSRQAVDPCNRDAANSKPLRWVTRGGGSSRLTSRFGN